MTRSRASAQQKCRLELDGVSFEVDPAAGGRITSFRRDGIEALAGPDVDPNNYGSTMWTSPQSDWGWPPPAEFDARPFALSASGHTLTLVGTPAKALGVRLEKRFSLVAAKGAISLEYSIYNVSRSTRSYAPWEVSRVPAGGVAFFPAGDWETGPLPVERHDGMTWYAHRPETLDDKGQKYAADGKSGYLAHAGRGLLFLKTFADLPPQRQAPGEGEVEIYANNRYVEVEVQGPYLPIPPGGVTRWTVTWYLRKLDPRVDVAVGSAALQAHVRDLLAM